MDPPPQRSTRRSQHELTASTLLGEMWMDSKCKEMTHWCPLRTAPLGHQPERAGASRLLPWHADWPPTSGPTAWHVCEARSVTLKIVGVVQFTHSSSDRSLRSSTAVSRSSWVASLAAETRRVLAAVGLMFGGAFAVCVWPG